MKKQISIILCFLILISAAAVAVSAADDTLPFIVATDLHYAETPQTAPVNFPGSTYYTAGTGTTLRAESRAIVRQFLREAADSEAPFVLLCGDLTEDGTRTQHRELAALLADFERESGKEVFVIDGNHDFHSAISIPEFKAFYADFGYSQALEVDEETCSYTAELGGRYRLLAFDSCDHTRGGDGITDARLAWAEKQAKQAEKDGKKLIMIMHHNLLEHIKLESKLLPAFIVRPSVDLKNRLLDWGVRYVFTGHLHEHDVLDYTDQAGRKVYDVTTTSLSGYPCAYRVCSLTGEGMALSTCYLQRLDLADIPQTGYTPQLLDEIQNDLETYAYGCFRNAFSLRKESFFSESALRNILSRFGGDAVQKLLDTCYPAFYANIALPIYTKDAPDGRSLQALAEGLGLHMPETDCETVSDCLFYFIVVMYCGDESVPYNDETVVLFMQCVYSALYNAMGSVNADLRQQLLADVRNNFKEAALPYAVTGAAKTALGTVKDDRLLEAVLLLMSPVIEMYSVDDGPADINVFLPDANDAPQTVLSTVMYYLRWILNYLKRVWNGFGKLWQYRTIRGARLAPIYFRHAAQ